MPMPVSLTEMKIFSLPDGGLDVNDRILVAEFDRVVDQVVENLLDFSEIGVDHLDAIRKGQVKRDAFRAARALEVAAVSLIVRLISKFVRVK